MWAAPLARDRARATKLYTCMSLARVYAAALALVFACVCVCEEYGRRALVSSSSRLRLCLLLLLFGSSVGREVVVVAQPFAIHLSICQARAQQRQLTVARPQRFLCTTFGCVVTRDRCVSLNGAVGVELRRWMKRCAT